MSWNNEESIKRAILRWLDKKGFKNDGPRTDELHGVDIKRWSDVRRKYWFIEVKGAPQATYQKGKLKGQKKKTNSQRSQRYIWFISALGQLALRMKQENANYGVALPDTEYNRKYIDTVGLFRKRARVNFLLVNESEEVSQLTPQSKRFKRV